MKKYLYGIFIAFLGIISPIHAEETQENQVLPIVVVGGGPGALTSAVYLQRAGIETLVLEGQTPGGAISQSPTVHNWPGEIEIDGMSLVEKIKAQAEHNGAKIVQEEVVGIDFSKRPFILKTRDIYNQKKTRTIQAKSVILAMGSMPKLLGVPGESGEKGYWTKGVYSCAVCDGGLYKDKNVAVIGGGDSAVLEADYLSKIAKKVYIILRSDKFRSNETRRTENLLKKGNVEVLYNTKIDEILGDGMKVTHLNLSTKKKLPIDGIFVAIGATPNSTLVKSQLELDAKGYIALKNDQETSIPGVFAIGDIVDPEYKQAISAAGDGAKAALQAERYLSSLSTDETNIIQVKNSSSTPYEIHSNEDFYSAVNDTSSPLLVDFYSPLCGPCKQLSPQIDEASKKYHGKIRFIKVDVTKFANLAEEYNVYAVPTVLLFQKGKVSKKGTGLEETKEIIEKLDSIRS